MTNEERLELLADKLFTAYNLLYRESLSVEDVSAARREILYANCIVTALESSMRGIQEPKEG